MPSQPSPHPPSSDQPPLQSPSPEQPRSSSVLPPDVLPPDVLPPDALPPDVVPTDRSLPRHSGARPTRSVRRDRRGRGLRRPLLSPEVPNSRTRAQRFDLSVLSAVDELEELWGRRLAAIEFAVDEVPPLPTGAETASPDVVLDGAVPLSRFVPPGVDRRGRATKARIIIYRRPIEGRANDLADINDLVAEVLTEQVASVLGDPPEG